MLFFEVNACGDAVYPLQDVDGVDVVLVDGM